MSGTVTTATMRWPPGWPPKRASCCSEVREELADATEADRKAAGDKRSHDYLMEALARERPDDAVLSEEGVDDPVRLKRRAGVDRRPAWTAPGSSPNSAAKTGPCTSRCGNPVQLVAGAVALPAQGVTLATPDPAPPPAHTGEPRIVVSRTRPPAIALQVRDRLDGTLVEMGSAGAKVAAVIQGLADVYVHAGGQYEWDSAAPVAVARAAGLHTSRIDGSPLEYNRADPLLPDLVVCRPEYADAVLAVTG